MATPDVLRWVFTWPPGMLDRERRYHVKEWDVAPGNSILSPEPGKYNLEISLPKDYKKFDFNMCISAQYRTINFMARDSKTGNWKTVCYADNPRSFGGPTVQPGRHPDY